MKVLRYDRLFIVCMFVLFGIFLFLIQSPTSPQQRTIVNERGFIDMVIHFRAGINSIPVIYFSTDKNLPLDVECRVLSPIPWLIPWVFTNNIPELLFNQEEVDELTKFGVIAAGFVIFMMSFMLLFQLANMKTGKQSMKFLSVLALSFSSIFIMTFSTGNSMMLTVAFLAFFAANYNSDNKTLRELSYISLALAVMFKLVPAFMGILLLFNKQWKASIKVAVYSLLLIFTPFFFIDSSLGISGEGGIISNFLAGVSQWIKILTLYGAMDNAFPVSIGFNLFDDATRSLIKKWIYVGCVIVSIPAIVTAPFLKKEDEWKKVFLMMMTMILLNKGAIHAIYLLFLFPCIIMFLNADLKVNFKNTFYFISIILMLSPVQSGKFLGLVTISWTLVKLGFLSLFAHLLYDSVVNFIRSRKSSKEGAILTSAES
ncbi:MAG: glycosyltransferase 87 family protein [Rickettsiales bacterium]|jgi:hypothetical protein|nr:glycosyltransferase 87 family protein [Rickettsiales bacterium]